MKKLPHTRKACVFVFIFIPFNPLSGVSLFKNNVLFGRSHYHIFLNSVICSALWTLNVPPFYVLCKAFVRICPSCFISVRASLVLFFVLRPDPPPKTRKGGSSSVTQQRAWQPSAKEGTFLKKRTAVVADSFDFFFFCLQGITPWNMKNNDICTSTCIKMWLAKQKRQEDRLL